MQAPNYYSHPHAQPGSLVYVHAPQPVLSRPPIPPEIQARLTARQQQLDEARNANANANPPPPSTNPPALPLPDLRASQPSLSSLPGPSSHLPLPQDTLLAPKRKRGRPRIADRITALQNQSSGGEFNAVSSEDENPRQAPTSTSEDEEPRAGAGAGANGDVLGSPSSLGTSGGGGSQSRCPICLEALYRKRTGRTKRGAAERGGVVPPCEVACGHLFHRDCIEQWLDCQNTCPECRYVPSLLLSLPLHTHS